MGPSLARPLLEQLLAADALCVLRVLDLHPRSAIAFHILPTFPLGNDTLEVLFARQLKQFLPSAYNMVNIEEA